MVTTVSTPRTFAPRFKALVVAGLLTLSLTVGTGVATSPVGAAAPQGAQGDAQSATVAVLIPEATGNGRNGGGGNGQEARRKREYCRVIPYEDWNILYPNDPSDVGGMYCWKA